MTANSIKLDISDGVAVITFDRAEKMNAFDKAMCFELIEVLDASDENDDVKAVIVTGDGRAFCAGADISSGSDGFTEGGLDKDTLNKDGSINYSHEKVRDFGGFLTLRLFDMKKPIIAAVNGAAVGMGSSMLLPMDYRIASSKAKFGFVFTRRGIVTESNSSYFLPRIVGITQALDWCLTGRVFGADEALAAGMISEVCEPEVLLARAHEIARNIFENTAPVSVALTRQMLWKSLGLDHPMEAHRYESRGVYSRAASADAAEGIDSFLEKRPAKFPLTVSKDMPDFYPWWAPRNYS